MLTSARRSLSYPNAATRADSADVPRDIATVIAALELDVVFGQGTHAARPAPGAGAPAGTGGGRLYWETDTLLLFYDNGAAWINLTPTVAPGAGSITTAMLASSVPVVPIGGLMDWPWGSGSIPSWALMPVGQLLTQAAYTALYAIASTGYPWGGSGTNFNLPDARARIMAGADDMGGVAAGRITIGINGVSGGLGAIAGSEGVVLTTAQIPAHNHAITDPGHVHNILSNGNINQPASGLSGYTNGGNSANSTAFNSAATTGISVNNAGGGGAHSSLQPTLFVNKIMRVL